MKSPCVKRQQSCVSQFSSDVVDLFDDLADLVGKTGELDQSEKKGVVVRGNGDNISQILLWHAKLGHIGARRMMHTLSHAGIAHQFTEREAVRVVGSCLACAAARGHKVAHPVKSQHRSTTPGEVWHLDTFGPARTQSVGGALYFALLVDECSLFTYVFFGSKKNLIAESVVVVLRQMLAQNMKLRALSSDNAAEYNVVWNFCQSVGVKVNRTVPGESSQNGLVERLIGVFCERWRSIRSAANAPKAMWGEGIAHIRFIHNNTAHVGLGWKSPAEVLFGKALSIANVVPFGCSVFVRRENADKLSDRAEEGCFLGADDMMGRKGWRVWFGRKSSVESAWNVEFKADVFPWMRGKTDRHYGDDDDVFKSPAAAAPPVSAAPPAVPPPPPPPSVPPGSVDGSSVAPIPVVLPQGPSAACALPPGTIARALDDSSNSSSSSAAVGDQNDIEIDDQIPADIDDDQDPIPHQHDNPEPPPPVPVVAPAAQPHTIGGHSLRPGRGAPPTRFSEVRTHVADTSTDSVVDHSEALPATYAAAEKGKNGTQWRAAWLKELASLRKFEVFEEIEELPKGKRCLKGKIVLAQKKDAAGKIIKFKARFVACGYDQRDQIDYFSTKADVAETRSLRLVLALGVAMRGCFFQGDVASAFLQSSLEEEIYMVAPPGYCKAAYVRLRRPLYGLKQSGRQWRTTFDTSLKDCGLQACERDPGIYFLQSKGRVQCLLMTHVDDFLGWAVSDVVREEFLKKLSNKHEMTYTKEVTSFLGYDIKIGGGVATLSQTTYINRFMQEFGYGNIHPKRAPAEKHLVIEPASEEEKIENVSDRERHEYASRVGALSYLSTHTRLDIAFITNQLARFMPHPFRRVALLLPDVFAYVALYKRWVLRYGGGWSGGVRLVGFCDASFPHSREPYPQIGYIFFLVIDGVWNVISWVSRRLKHVCLSTEEAELAAASEAAREAIALKLILVQLGLLQSDYIVVLYIDNSGAVHSAKDGGYYPKLKHVNIEHKFVMQACAEHGLEVAWVSGKENPSDVLTKSLSGAELDSVRKRLFVQLE